MHLIGMARLGRDAEVRYTPQGDAVANLSLCFNYGKADGQGQRPTTWVDAALWGERAEKLAQYLTKGGAHSFIVADVHMEEYEGRNGKGVKLVGRVMDVTLGPRQDGGSGGGQRSAAPAPAQRSQAPAPAPKAATGFDDMDDDIPFN